MIIYKNNIDSETNARSFNNFFIISIPTIIILILFFEIFFRIIIPANNPPLNEFSEKHQFLRYSNKIRTGQYTIGKFAEIRTKWTINNEGFNYPINFENLGERDSIPLIAIIGDSYIEAFQVDSDKSYPYLLRNMIYPNYEVYGIGISGAPLSHYYHLNTYINKYFDPEIIIFQLIHNDFDQSFWHKSHNSIWWQIEKLGDKYQFRPPSLIDFKPTSSLYKKILYKSATFRYLHRNLFVFAKIRGINYGGVEDRYESNTIIINEKKQLEIYNGIDFLFDKIKQENKNKRVIFIFDAPRGKIYNNELETSKVMWMHKMVKILTLKYNFELIDLTEPMRKKFLINGKKFNSEIDGHWNEYGHELISKICYNYLEGNINHWYYCLNSFGVK